MDSKSDLTASAVRLTTSSSVEMRSSRCSSKGISSCGSPLSSTTPTPERTRSFELQRAQILLLVGVPEAADLAVHSVSSQR